MLTDGWSPIEPWMILSIVQRNSDQIIADKYTTSRGHALALKESPWTLVDLEVRVVRSTTRTSKSGITFFVCDDGASFCLHQIVVLALELGAQVRLLFGLQLAHCLHWLDGM